MPTTTRQRPAEGGQLRGSYRSLLRQAIAVKDGTLRRTYNNLGVDRFCKLCGMASLMKLWHAIARPCLIDGGLRAEHRQLGVCVAVPPGL